MNAGSVVVRAVVLAVAAELLPLLRPLKVLLLHHIRLLAGRLYRAVVDVCVCVCVCAFVFLVCFLSMQQFADHQKTTRVNAHTHIEL